MDDLINEIDAVGANSPSSKWNNASKFEKTFYSNFSKPSIISNFNNKNIAFSQEFKRDNLKL